MKMNYFYIEVITDENGTLMDVNLRGPGSFSGSYDVEDANYELLTILEEVGKEILHSME